MGENPVADWTALERHRARRAQRVPTVSVLVGDPDAGEWVWDCWQRQSGRSSVHVAASGCDSMLQKWLAHRAITGRYIEELWNAIADHSGVTIEEARARMAARTEWQRREVVAELAPVLELSADLVDSVLRGASDEMAQRILDGFPANLVGVARMLGPAMPALFVHGTSMVAGVGEALLLIAETVPGVDLAFAVAPAHWRSFKATADRVYATLREGVIEVEPSSADGGNGRAGDSSIRYDAVEFARSRAERALFRRLQERPATKGRFHLNVRLDERFGGAELEIDLLSAPLKIAVEIDGYYHFRDSSAYRRDRKKDLLLQSLGYLVVRVLASDVEEEPEYVLEQIDRAVEQRLARST